MAADNNRTNFSNLIGSIEKNEVLLPDFQRGFVWDNEDVQRKLIASVLCKMPIGSILLLKSPASEYLAKKIGCKTEVDVDNIAGEVQFLLDGQQRITVLANVFSNIIHSSCQKVTDLSSTALKKRFFIRLPKRSANKIEDDLFGAKTLKFPYQPASSSIPTFLTSDILPFIEIKSFTAKDETKYNPRNTSYQGLVEYCVGNKNGYLLPLYLLIPTGKENTRDATKKCYKKIINKISQNIVEEIIDEIDNAAADKKLEILKNIYCDNEEIEVFLNDDKKLENALKDTADIWRDEIKDYIMSCINGLDLMQIIIEASNRARAIDIYENLNRGGVSLNTFDLLMARVAKVDHKNFYKRITDYLQQEKQYNKGVAPEKIINFIPQKYNASMQIESYVENKKNPLSPTFINVFLSVLGLYCNNKELMTDKFKKEYTKRDAILNLSPEDIHKNCETVLDAIDRAFFFFQTRCGIRKIQDINYSLMIVVVGVVFLDRRNFENKNIHNLLEAWYWSSLFSGEYDKDQTETMKNNLVDIYQNIRKEKEVDWINSLKNDIFRTKNFSDKDLLLMKKAEEGRTPKNVLRNFICQYWLAKTYPDMFSGNKISVFCVKAKELEAHHIVPLGSAKKIGESSKNLRNNEKHICNSPVNFVYITKEDNKKISDTKLIDYVNSIKPEAKSNLHLTAYSVNENLDTDEKIMNFLKERLDWLDGDIREHVKDMLKEWHSNK